MTRAARTLALLRALREAGGRIPASPLPTCGCGPVTLTHGEAVVNVDGRLVHVQGGPDGDVITDITDNQPKEDA